MNNYFKYLQEQEMRKNIRQANKGLIFLSETNMHGKTLIPRIPKNFFTENGFEDNKTKRVCFAQSIDKCLLGLSMNCKGKIFYVHTPVGQFNVIHPTKEQVPDVHITGETWICEPVKIECLGKIKVIGDDDLPGRKYTYGNGIEAELYGYMWKYIV
jgi:hypothetical protein